MTVRINRNQSMLLSFDIGTRHLAYCALALSKTEPLINPPSIYYWSVVDLLSIPNTPYSESAIHTTVKNWTIQEMRDYLERQECCSVGKREELKRKILEHLSARGISKVTPNNPCLLAVQLYAYLDSQPWMLECDAVVIENQPCLTNPIMKSVQLLLFGYFMYNGVWTKYSSNQDKSLLPKVSLVSASNKLKASIVKNECESEGEKQSYKERKQNAISTTTKLLHEWSEENVHDFKTWKSLFDTSNKKKQDDLSDCLLQGLYVLRKPIVEARQHANKKAVKIALRASKTALTAAKKVQNKIDGTIAKATKKKCAKIPVKSI